MDTIQILRTVSKLVYENVKELAGTAEAMTGDFGRGAGGDISRNIDIVAERTVINYLKKINFDCTILGEECGKVELSVNPKGFVIMDAIDGTTNAIRGLPFFCCSLAFAIDEKLSSITDAVITNLSTGDIYWASEGKGAFLNDKSISVNQEKPIYKVVGINTSNSSPELIQRLAPIFEKNHHTRHFGANALEMAFFAQGLIDVFIDFRKKIRIQDMAAGYLLVKEAGGLILDENMQPLDSDLNYETRLSFVAAANKEILDEVFSLIK
jgi:myo-inositol-1(or 4)-monophosphatase